MSLVGPNDSAEQRHSSAPEQTEALGAALGSALREGDLVLLSGPLGAGKTRFVAGLARALGSRGRVRSPSFTLVNEYAGETLRLYHLDLYRLEEVDSTGLGLDEMLDRGVVVVEWGERLPMADRVEALELEFALVSETERRITASGQGARGLELLEHWRHLRVGQDA